MKVSPKTTVGNGTNRISALKRLSKPTANNKDIHRRLSAPTTMAPVVTDARQLLSNRNKAVFDARQLLSRQSSKTSAAGSKLRQKAVEMEEDEQPLGMSNPAPLFVTRMKGGRLNATTAARPTPTTTRNSQLTEPISFTKTIKNTSFRQAQPSNPQPAPSDQKVIISFVNDQYRKRPKSPSPAPPSPPPPPPPPPSVRRLHDASMQTTQASSSSRAPIRTGSTRNYSDDQYEPPVKRTTSRTTAADREQHAPPSSSKSPLKRTATEAFSTARSKPTSSSRADSNTATVLITNLQSTVTEDDVIELFSEVGDINNIKTLSRGCVEIIYATSEQAEDAVARYHNRLLDGKLMYVSLQQPPAYSTKSSKTTTSQHSKSTTAKDQGSSSQSSVSKSGIDPAFIRQALFNPSANNNAVQFQVKL